MAVMMAVLITVVMVVVVEILGAREDKCHRDKNPTMVYFELSMCYQ